jgi:protein phosphatase
MLLAGIIAGIGFVAYQYTQTRYYVDTYQGQVTIFQGIRESLGPLSFSTPFVISDVSVSELSTFQQTLIERSISAESLADAERILAQLKESLNE